MVLFLFGLNPDSWAIGNSAFTAHQNLPGQLDKSFKNKSLCGDSVTWGSTGPSGLYCFHLKATDSLWVTQDPNLLADTKPQNQYNLVSQPVKHVSFSPGGGWFVRYTNGTVRLSMKGTFSDSFHRLAAPYMQTKGSAASSPQTSQIQYVFFGASGSILMQLADESTLWEGIPQSLATEIREKADEGWTLTRNTKLCPWDSQYYFAEWTRTFGMYTVCSWDVRPSGILTDILVREVVEGGVPVSQTVYRSPAPPPPITKPEPPPVPESELARVEFDYKKTEDDELELREGEYIQNIVFVSEGWWKGQNASGMAGLFPANYVKLVEQEQANSSEDALQSPFSHEQTSSGTPVGPIWCDGCQRMASGHCFHCSICNEGDFDLCQNCVDSGHACAGHHLLTRRVIKASTNLLDSNLPNISGLNLSNDNSNTRGDDDQKLRGSLQSSIVSEKPNVRWDDVAGLDAAKEELQEAVVLPIKFPGLFNSKRKPRRAMLLYGPPGTGKSYLAKAVATEVESTLFSVSSSDIMSKWYGESERLVKTLFDMARENKPSIIFIDEIEALCGNRDDISATEQSNRVKTEFLVQMDGVGHENKGVLVLGATNLPWSLDPAMRRRFQRKIHIGLPDAKAREHLFQVSVGDTPCELRPRDYAELGRRTEGFSGSDISIVVQDALMQPVKKVHTSKYWAKVYDRGVEKLTPCSQHTQGAIPMTWRDVSASTLMEPRLSAEDFFVVLAKTKPSVSEEDCRKHHEWTEKHGQEGA